MNTSTKMLLESLFRKLNEEGIEYVIQQSSSGLPQWLLRLLMKLVVKLDAVIYLRGKYEIVLKRKQELMPEEFWAQLGQRS